MFFRDGLNWKNGVRINNRELQQMIARIMGWDLDNYNYRADGFYSNDDNAMIFDLKNARTFNKQRYLTACDPPEEIIIPTQMIPYSKRGGSKDFSECVVFYEHDINFAEFVREVAQKFERIATML